MPSGADPLHPMHALLEKMLLVEPKGRLPGFRWVRLGLIIVLMVGSTILAVVDRYRSFDKWLLPLLGLNLLFQHLTTQCRLRRNVLILLRSIYLISTVVIIIYFPLCLWSWYHRRDDGYPPIESGLTTELFHHFGNRVGGELHSLWRHLACLAVDSLLEACNWRARKSFS